VTPKPCLPAFLTVHCVVRMKCFAVSLADEDPSKLRRQISSLVSSSKDVTVIEVPLTTITKINGQFKDVYNLHSKEDVAAFMGCVDTSSICANGEEPPYTLLELQDLWDQMQASPAKMKSQALSDLVACDSLDVDLTLTQITGSEARVSKRRKGVSASPGKTDDQARKEGKAKKSPRWKAIEELLKDIDIQKASNKLIKGVFCEGGKVTPPTQIQQYVRTPKVKVKPMKSARRPSKRPATTTPATIIKDAEKRLKANQQRKESDAVVELKTKLAEKILDTETLKTKLAKTEERIEGWKTRAELAEYKLAGVEKNHELMVRAVRAEVQVEMLTRPPTQPSSNARSRSDSPAGRFLSMDHHY
jgi:hypothetical protein